MCTKPMYTPHTQHTHIHTHARARTGFKAAFEAPSSISAPAAPHGGAEVAVEVAFEPCGLGEGARDTLIVSSPIGERACTLLLPI